MQVKKKTNVIQEAITLGDEHDGDYLVMPHIGHITEPVVINEWKFIPFEQDTSYKPSRALFHLELMKKHFPVDQVLIAHEPKPKQKEIKAPELPKANNENLKRFLSVAAKVFAVGVVVVGYAAHAALATITVFDPLLIVTFEGEEDWMLCIAQWDEV